MESNPPEPRPRRSRSRASPSGSATVSSASHSKSTRPSVPVLAPAASPGATASGRSHSNDEGASAGPTTLTMKPTSITLPVLVGRLEDQQTRRRSCLVIVVATTEEQPGEQADDRQGHDHHDGDRSGLLVPGRLVVGIWLGVAGSAEGWYRRHASPAPTSVVGICVVASIGVGTPVGSVGATASGGGGEPAGGVGTGSGGGAPAPVGSGNFGSESDMTPIVAGQALTVADLAQS